MKIAQKFLLTFAGIVFLVAITVLVFVYRSFSVTMETQIRDKLVAVSSYAMEKIDRLLYRRYERVEALAADPVIRSRTSSPPQIAIRLDEFRKRFEVHHPYISLSFFDLNKKLIADTRSGDAGKRSTCLDSWPGIADGNDFVLSILKSQSSSESFFCFTRVVKDQQGIPFGVVVARTPIDELKFLIDRPLGLFNIALTPEIDLVDKDGRIIYSDHEREGDLGERLSNWDTIRRALSSGKSTGSMILPAEKKQDGDNIVIYTGGERHARLGTDNWTLVVSLPKKAALDPVLKMRNSLIVIIITLALVALLVAYVLSRTITRPIILLSNAAAEVAKGNRDVSVEIDSRDEVGQLGRSFNFMVESLAQTEREREKLVGELREALGTIKTLEGILPICSCCKKIRDDAGYWNHIETYISKHTDAVFTHGLCMDCAKKLYPGHLGKGTQE